MNEATNSVMEVEKKPLKLNYPRTIKVGFAFAIISLFWAAYDFVIPLLLENAYGLSNTLRGVIMGLDNLLSLFLLPIFGKISDKAKGSLVSKFGKRTPFILIGTIIAATLMIFVPISAKNQMVQAENTRNAYYLEISENSDILKEKLNEFYGNTLYSDVAYLNQNNISKEDYVNISYNFVTTTGFLNKTYYYNQNKITKEEYNALKAENANYNKFVSSGMKVWMSEQVNSEALRTDIGRNSLIGFMIILFFTLLAMATFRSPAVALMPDVTPKPLRSQGNAIINLAGGLGAAIAFIIYTIVLFRTDINNYIIIFSAVSGAMLLLLMGFILLVKERKWTSDCEELSLEYGIYTKEEVDADRLKIKKPPLSQRSLEEKAKFKSFLLILASIFMWFMGYNAVSSTMSIYCTKALNLDAGIASIVSGVSMAISAIAFIPVGIMAVKIGRRKSIIIGFSLAIASFVLIFFFVRQSTTPTLPAVLFSLFYLIAGFGLIITNVNTFPMVVELADADEIGKYTGFYYTATMSAQAITPMLAGLVMDHIGMKYLFAYSAAAVIIAMVIMSFVKHGDSKLTGKLTKDEKKQAIYDAAD